MSKEIEIISKLIKNFFKNKNKFEGWFTSYDDEYQQEYIIEYTPSKLFIEKDNNKKSLCSFNGEIEITVNSIKVFDYEERVWVSAYRDDLPEYVWDDLNDNISIDLDELLPQVCLKFNFMVD